MSLHLDDRTKHSPECMAALARAQEMSAEYTILARTHGIRAAERWRQEADRALAQWVRIDALCTRTYLVQEK